MRNHKLIRILSALLAMIMMISIVSLFAGCSGAESEETESESVTEADTSEEKDSYESLTHTKYNKELKIVSLSSYTSDFQPDESTKGETLTDEMITRNMRIQNDYGVTMAVTEIADYDKLITEMDQQQRGQLDNYDVYVGQLYNFTGNALQNHCVDFNEMPGINIEGEWWDPACTETLVIDGKNFMLTGDISSYSMLISACLAFNKNLMSNEKLDEPYDLVEDDEWTLDALFEYVNGFTNESALNGLGQFGMTCWSLDVPYSLFYGANETFVKFDEDTGTPVISYDERKVINIYDKIYKIIVTAEANYWTINDAMAEGETVNVDKPAYDVFAEGRALFVDITLGKISEYITEMQDDYGVVPMPKYDTAQKEYLTFVNGAAPLFFVSTTEKDLAFVGNMLEALATYSYEYITNDLYEIISKSKDARDPQTADMVDIVLRSRVYDFAYYGKFSLANLVSDNLLSEKDTIASQLTGAKKGSESALRKLLSDWQKIQNQVKK